MDGRMGVRVLCYTDSCLSSMRIPRSPVGKDTTDEEEEKRRPFRNVTIIREGRVRARPVTMEGNVQLR